MTTETEVTPTTPVEPTRPVFHAGDHYLITRDNRNEYVGYVIKANEYAVLVMTKIHEVIDEENGSHVDFDWAGGPTMYSNEKFARLIEETKPEYQRVTADTLAVSLNRYDAALAAEKFVEPQLPETNLEHKELLETELYYEKQIIPPPPEHRLTYGAHWFRHGASPNSFVILFWSPDAKDYVTPTGDLDLRSRKGLGPTAYFGPVENQAPDTSAVVWDPVQQRFVPRGV